MKNIKILLLIVLFFPTIIYADLTENQAEDLASFAKNFILEGSKRVGTDGFSIFAYMQGQARIDGYQGKMYYVNSDYQKINTVRAYKWTFDCSSFASYIYYHVFDLVLTRSNTKNVDSYSGLTLMNPTANPYQVSDYVTNANNNKHFYYIKKDVIISDINFNELKKGDLIIFVGSHIMVYVGDGLIAHASTSAINKSNLGLEVVKIKEKFPSKKASIIRLKDKIIPPEKEANMKVTWPDNGKTEVIGKDALPTIEATNDGIRDNQVSYTIKLSDDRELKGYSVKNEKSTPTKWDLIQSYKTYTFKCTFSNNGTYYVYVIDSRNQISMKELTVSNIYKDTTSPIIENIEYGYNTKTGKYNITVTATDESKITYSLDGINYIDGNYFDNLEKKTYTLYIKDAYDNIIKQDFVISDLLLPQITVDYYKGYSQEVTIKITTDKEDEIKGYNLTRTNTAPSYYIQYTGIIEQKIIENGTYYIWVSTKSGIVNYKEIVINNIDKTPPQIKDVVINYNDNRTANIEVIAEDTGCSNLKYSIDGLEYININKFDNIDKSKITVYVKDSCSNINVKKVDLNFPEVKEEPVVKKKGSSGIIYIIILLLILLGGAGTYIFIKKRNNYN